MAAVAQATYRPRSPASTVLYRTVQENWLGFQDLVAREERRLPRHVVKEFEGFLRCGIHAHGFLRLQCKGCRAEKFVAFSCKKRGFCPSCGGRRMNETAAHLTDRVFPKVGVRQWVVSFPMPVRADGLAAGHGSELIRQVSSGRVLIKAPRETLN